MELLFQVEIEVLQCYGEVFFEVYLDDGFEIGQGCICCDDGYCCCFIVVVECIFLYGVGKFYVDYFVFVVKCIQF